MRGKADIKTRACRNCKVVYTGTRSYCSGRCESAWKYHHKHESGEKVARMLKVVEEMNRINLNIEVCMPWERSDLQKAVTLLQEEYESLNRELIG